MACEVVVPGCLSSRSSSSESRLSAAVGVTDSDGCVRVDVVERRLQRARARVRAVAILNPSILKVRLQLCDVVVGLGGLLRGLRGLLVGLALVHGSLAEEHFIIWRNFGPLDGH